MYNTVEEACRQHHAGWSVIFVPPEHAKDAALEALDNELHIVIITEHIPVHDAVLIMQTAAECGRMVIGPNCPGIIVPGETKIGIMPHQIFTRGNVGIVSRSGTLTYEMALQLSKAGVGQSTVVGIGGDQVTGLHFTDVLQLFEQDAETKCIVMIGEIGGNLEELAAVYAQKNVTKPIVAYVAGRCAPPGKTMGHAGAIIQGSAGRAEDKIVFLNKHGVRVGQTINEVVQIVKQTLKKD